MKRVLSFFLMVVGFLFSCVLFIKEASWFCLFTAIVFGYGMFLWIGEFDKSSKRRVVRYSRRTLGKKVLKKVSY